MTGNLPEEIPEAKDDLYLHYNYDEIAEHQGQDYEEAAKYFQMAADQGFVAAQFNLGDMYYIGEGVEQDYDEALRYFTLAAEQEFPNAMFMFGHVLSGRDWRRERYGGGSGMV